MNEPSTKVRRYLEWAGVAALSALLLVAVEVALRLADRLESGTWRGTRVEQFERRIRTTFDLYRRHAYLNTAPRESSSATAFGKRASFNSLGYRSPERPLAKTPGVHRWVFAGGSTTFDLLAENDDDAWPARLEALLLTSGDCRFEAWNAGFPGWTSVENVSGVFLRDLDLKPDGFVLFQGINDLQPAAHRPFDRHYEAHARKARRALGFDLPALGWSDRSLLLEKIQDFRVGPQDPWQRVGPSDLGARRREIEPESLEVFERNLRAFLSLAQGAGAQVVLVTQTTRLRDEHLEADRRYLGGWVPGLEPESVAPQLERLNDVTRGLAGEGVRVIDAARDIAWEDDHFGDAMHFSARGSEVFADYLAQRLKPVLGCGAGHGEP
ncbi:MAG: SGNH/GDSL hydrolase family protein [Acidobacteriota bacterium]